MSLVNRVIAMIVAVAAMAAAAAVVVVAAAFAIYTVLRDHFGPAAAAAIIAAAFAVALILTAIILFRKAAPPRVGRRAASVQAPQTVTDKILSMLTERPIVSAAAAAAAGLLAWRNPSLISTLLKALDLKPDPPSSRR